MHQILPSFNPLSKVQRLLDLDYLTNFSVERTLIGDAAHESPDLFNDLFSELIKKKAHQTEMGVEASEKQRLSVAADVQALLQLRKCISTASSYSGERRRFLYVTGDIAIHRLVDAWYDEGGRPAGFPDYNFLRHPLQFTDLFGPARVPANREVFRLTSRHVTNHRSDALGS